MRRKRSLSATAAAVIIVVIIVVGAAAFLLSQHGGGKTTTSTPTATTTTTTSTTTTTTSTTSTTTTTTTTSVAATTTTTTTSGKGVTLVILTRHPGDIIDKARVAFLKSDIAKKYNIKELKFIQLPPGLWESYIKSTPVDVAWGGGPTLFDMLYIDGYLAPLTSDIALKAASQIPDVLAGSPMKRVGKDGKLYWVAAAIASFGFTVHTKLAKQVGLQIPQSWKDLASISLGEILVKYGKPALGIADPTASTSNTRMYEIILQAYGWDEGWRILTLMAANAHVYSGSGDVRDAVIRGERVVGITIDFYGYTAHMEEPACEYIAPKGETIVNGDPIALVSNSKHPEAAQAFIAWVLTDGQKVWLDPDINRLPANPNVFKTPEGQKRQDLYQEYEKMLHAKSMKFNDTLALEYEYAMQLYFKATLVDAHSHLQNAWIALLKAYMNKKISDAKFKELEDKLTSLPVFKDPATGKEVKFTQDYAISINNRLKKDQAFKSEIMSRWREAAIAKYDEVYKAVSGG